MKINRDIRSPNYESISIPVEFVVLHYTAGNLQRAMNLFTDVKRRVSCHLLICEEGNVFEIVKCWDGLVYKARHTGESRFYDGKRKWEKFNNFSIGIELVNLDGNILEYTEQQYETLFNVIKYLKSLYPALQSPGRVVGHEHIAGWRGKVDPGIMFNWERFYKQCYTDKKFPIRKNVCPSELKIALEKFLRAIPKDKSVAMNFWHALNYMTETCVRLLNKKGDTLGRD